MNTSTDVTLCEQCGRPILQCIDEAIARIKAEPQQQQKVVIDEETLHAIVAGAII